MSVDERRATLRRFLGWALVVGLTVAALTASIAITSGSFDEEEWQVIGTSLGFAVFSALGAAGASLRVKGGPRLLGDATVALAGASFLCLLLAIWINGGEDSPWRLWGCLSLATLAASHASLVTGARRPGDGEAVRLLSSVSIGLGVVDALAGIVPLADLVDVGEGAEVIAVLVIALLLTTALPPILRRLQDTPAARSVGLADEVIAAADRIEALSDGKMQIRRECERLRGLARSSAR